MERSTRDERLELRVEGLDCPTEVAILQRAVGPLVGGAEQLTFDVLQGRMTVVAPRVTDRSDEIVQAIARAGLRAYPWAPHAARDQQADVQDQRQWLLTIISGLALLAGLIAQRFADPWYARIALGISALVGSLPIWPRAWQALRQLRPDMHLLMAVAVVGAILLGEWSEAAAVAFLFAFSLRLEAWSVGRARRAIAALVDLHPPIARWIQDGKEVTGPADTVPLGAEVIVWPGEKLPIDGVVLHGASQVDQSPITGESQPSDKTPGAEVYAGTINGPGRLTIRCTRRADDSQLARIVNYVQAAQSRRAPSQQWVDRFAAIYTPLVLLTALLCWLVPPLLFRQPWSDWTYSALVLLVIACPCALVISTPVSIVAAVANAARRGVLIKGGRFVELPAHLTAIAFDKTGTLTHGQLTVTGVHPKTADGAGELMEQAVQLEHGQNHPIARAILHHGRHLGIQDLPSGAAPRLDGRTLPGRGTIARRGDREHWIGSPREARQRVGADPWLESQLAAIDADGCTAVVVGQADQVMGVISLSDTLRADAPAVLHELHSLGVRELWMLTGDQASAANSIARPLPLDRVSAELMPIDKVHAVEQLCGQHAIVAMVGDGVNDAPALTAATIGIAMGAIGSDLALETADIALMTDDLSRLPWLVRHARRTLRIIRQNVFFSLAVKLLFIGLTLAGHASLWLAILADTGAALLVTANALRLLRSPAGRQRSDKPADRSVDPG